MKTGAQVLETERLSVFHVENSKLFRNGWIPMSFYCVKNALTLGNIVISSIKGNYYTVICLPYSMVRNWGQHQVHLLEISPEEFYLLGYRFQWSLNFDVIYLLIAILK